MKPDLASMKLRFKEDVLNATREQAKGRISQKDLERLNPNINHFVYLTGYPAEVLEEKVGVIISSLPDEFFKQTFQKTKIKTATLIAEELMSTHYNLNNDGEFLDFFYELIDKIASFFKTSAIESLTQKSIEPLAKIDRSKLSARQLSDQLDSLDEEVDELQDVDPIKLREFAANCTSYISFLINKGNLLHLEDLSSGDASKRLECINEYLEMVDAVHNALIFYKDHKDIGILKALVTFYEQIPKNKLEEARAKLEITVMNGPQGDELLSNGLTKKQELVLRLFSRINSPISGEQLAILREFVESAVGNSKLNKALNAIMQLNKSDLPPGFWEAAEFFYDFSYNTMNNKIFLDSLPKLIRNEKNTQAGKDIDDNDKVTLREYAILTRYSKTKDSFEKLDRLGIVEGSNILKDIKQKVSECAPIIKEVTNNILGEITYESGDILMANITREEEFRGGLDRGKRLSQLITEHAHTTKLVKDDKKPYISHVMYSGEIAETELLRVNQYLYSDVYNIKIEKLFSEEVKEKLEGHYGPQYVILVNEMYRKIEYDLHNNASKQFPNIIFPQEKFDGLLAQAKAGLASLIPPFGHRKINSESLEEFHRKMQSNMGEKVEMICSEFAARTTALAFIKLNEQLQKDLDTTENVIDIPFDARERFSKIHPDRLLKILMDKGCIEKAPRTKTETQFITFADRVKVSRPSELGR